MTPYAGSDINRGLAAIAARQAQSGMSGGSRAGRGSEATGYIPAAPNLGQTSADSIGINLGNMDNLQKLYDLVANKYSPGYSGNAELESGNIASLLGSGGRDPDTLRRAAEIGTHAGVAGAPITDAYNAFATHDQKLRDWQLGSSMLGSAATRGKGIMPFENFFVNPQMAYENDWLTKQLQAAPDPAAAYNLNAANAALGLRSGQRAGYGGGGGRSNALGVGGGNMIAGGAPSSNRVDNVVSKYSRTIQPTQPTNDGSGRVPYPNRTDAPLWYDRNLSNAANEARFGAYYYPETGMDSGMGVEGDQMNANYLMENGVYPGSTFNLDPGNEYDWTV